MKPYFLDLLLGKGKSPFRTENLFQTLSSVTVIFRLVFRKQVKTALVLNCYPSLLQALCCIDKKGILSWPNPTAEKVFFLRNGEPSGFTEEDVSVTSSPDHSRRALGAILKKEKRHERRRKRSMNKRGNDGKHHHFCYIS